MAYTRTETIPSSTWGIKRFSGSGYLDNEYCNVRTNSYWAYGMIGYFTVSLSGSSNNYTSGDKVYSKVGLSSGDLLPKSDRVNFEHYTDEDWTETVSYSVYVFTDSSPADSIYAGRMSFNYTAGLIDTSSTRTRYYFDVTFDKAGGSGGPSSAEYNVLNSTSTSFSIPSSSPTKKGHRFLGWTVDGGSTIYSPGRSVTLDTRVDHTFTAVWETLCTT